MLTEKEALCPDCGCRRDGWNPVSNEQRLPWAKCCGRGRTANETERDGLLATIKRLEATNARQLSALKRADQFITNGIDLGFIRMPNKWSDDPALETPGIIKSALEEKPE